MLKNYQFPPICRKKHKSKATTEGNPKRKLALNYAHTLPVHLGNDTMQILLDIPATLPDAIGSTPSQFAKEATMAMAVKLYELKRLSSGMAASLAGMGRVEFISELHRYGVALIDLDTEDLASDVLHA
jgi:predicted HTH domain antitoxin